MDKILFVGHQKQKSMYNCYNEGVNYLIGKYGSVKLGLTLSAESRLHKATTKKQKQEVQASFTERDYIVTYNLNGISEEDKTIHLLICQYNYGIEAKRELYYILLEKGVISEK